MLPRVLLVLMLLTLSACAAKVESAYPVPSIPEAATVTSELHGVSVAIQPFIDARLPASAEKQNVTLTQPEGPVSSEVENAFVAALNKQGAVVSTAPGVKSLLGEVRQWDSEVSASVSGNLSSKASLYLEVKDAEGNSLFEGEYRGSRSSKFPVIARQDVGDSLALAMAEAIEQALRDPQLRRVLR